MQWLLDFLKANPWIFAWILVGLAIWITALRVVIKSPKFRRKWLWALLSIFNFSYSWSVSPDMFVSVGIPVGAIYILWFWRYASAPTADAPERGAAQHQARSFAVGTSRQIVLLRAAYLAAAASAAIMVLILASGAMVGLMFDAMGGGKPAGIEVSMLQIAGYAGGAVAAALAALFVFLSNRPHWWGKLICGWAGLSWVFFSVVFVLMAPLNLVVGVILAAGLTLLAAGVLAQVVDPRFHGPPLQLVSSETP